MNILDQALEIMQHSDRSLFLTWKAWTWKSTLLQTFFSDSAGKQVIKLAPTWVAALHIGWETIHRFFGFPIDITVEKIKDGDFFMKRDKRMLLKAADCLVIDEISMVRADLFEVIDTVCQIILKNSLPFGGKQLVMIGDLFQLPPVFSEQERGAFTEKYKTEYFFSSPSFAALEPITLELQKVYRQTDQEFIGMLNAIRLWARSYAVLEYFNRACIDSFEELPASTVVVTATKKTASMLNMQLLNAINAEKVTATATVKWAFPQTLYPNEQQLSFKEWAQVMMLKNHKDGYWYNGSIWTIQAIKVDNDWEEYVEVMIDWLCYDVYKEPRDIHESIYNTESQAIEYHPIGSFVQYPFKLWWAITIHKSQWLTFENVCIDLGRGAFAQWQTYVALSRAKWYDGLFLNTPLQPRDIITDPRIISFIGQATSHQKIITIQSVIDTNWLIDFLYLNTKTWIIEPINQFQPVCVEQQERKGTLFDVCIGHLPDWETRRFAVKKMYEIVKG